MRLVKRIYFWFKAIGSILIFVGMAFVAVNMLQAQTKPATRLEVTYNGKTQGSTFAIQPNAVLNVSLLNLKPNVKYELSFSPHSSFTKGGARKQTIEPKFAFGGSNPSGCIPIEEYADSDIFEEGTPVSCVPGLDAITYNVAIKTSPIDCGELKNADLVCEIHLREAGKNTDAVPVVKVGKATTSSTKPGGGTPSVSSDGESLSVSKSTVYMGQPVTVTLKMPYNSSNPPTYQLAIEKSGISALEIRTQPLADQKQMQCTASVVGGEVNPWENFSGGCINSTFTATINSGILNEGNDEASSTYIVRLKKGGSDTKASTSITIKNVLDLKLEANPSRGKQASPNELSVDENVPVTATALGCTEGPVLFQLWGEPAGVACSLGGSCGYEYTYTGNPTATQDTATATYDIPAGLQLIGVTKRPLDQNDDGVAEIGAKATCETTGKTATGKITLYKEGTIQIEVVEKIIDNYDKGVKGLEVIPIVDPKSAIKYSVYGLRAGGGSPGGGPLDRSNCFYVELFRGGNRLKRPTNYPDAYLGQIRSGGPSCVPDATSNSSAILIDRPDYVFHVFDGSEASVDPYSNIILCAANACNTNQAQTNVLRDGEYTLKIYEANGLSMPPFYRPGCLTDPSLEDCGNVEDSLVASTTFQVGSALHKAAIPPCRVALVQHPNPGGELVSEEVTFDSIDEFNQYFADPLHKDYFMGKCLEVNTALGGFATDPAGFVTRLLGFLLGISGGIALLLIIRAGYQVMISRGDPEKIGEAREHLTSAIVGLLFIIFSLVILEVIGVDILKIPGLCSADDPDCINRYSAEDPSVSPTPPPL
jgi:hypothetical protein